MPPLNLKRAESKTATILFPLGDGTPRLRDPVNQNWYLAISSIMKVLMKQQEGLPMETFKEFSASVMFPKYKEGDGGVDVGLSMALTFENFIRNDFKNIEIQVKNNSYRTITAFPWASITFTLGSRVLGLHFLANEPYFEVFKIPEGDYTESKTLAPRHEARQQQQQPHQQQQQAMKLDDVITEAPPPGFE